MRVRAIITRDKEIVWEYFNPKLGRNGRSRAGLYRSERIPAAVVEPFLAKSRAAGPKPPKPIPSAPADDEDDGS